LCSRFADRLSITFDRLGTVGIFWHNQPLVATGLRDKVRRSRAFNFKSACEANRFIKRSDRGDEIE
jgi:hypothetical protein